MKKALFSSMMAAVLMLSGCLPGFTPVSTPTLPPATATAPLPTATPDPTKVALQAEATAMRDFLTQQAATLWPPTQTPPAAPSSDPALGNIPWAETISLPNRSSAALHPPQGLPLIFHNGYVYLFGGRSANDERLTSVYFSAINPDGTLAGWTPTTPLPGKYMEHQEVKIGNYVYMITGADSVEDVYYASFNEDGSLGAWQKTAPLSPSRQTFAAASYGNFIYAVGGNSGGPWDRVHYTSVKPDGSLYLWSDTTPLPAAIQEHTMIAYDGYLYVFGGKTVNDMLLTTVYFSAINPDGTLAGWLTAEPLPRQMYGYGAFESNGYVYLIGSDRSYFTRILEDHSLDLWQVVSPLPALRFGLRVGAYDGYAYAMGGYDFDSHQNSSYFGRIGSGTEIPVVQHPDCTSGWTRLQADSFARVSQENSLPNRVREAPDHGAEIIYQIYPGTIVRVMEGPVCADRLVYWKVEHEGIPGGAGWTAEGDGSDYYMERYPPLPLDATPLPTQSSTSQLAIAGGTYFDSGVGVTGTGFVFRPVLADGRTIDHIEIQGPPAWNANEVFQLYPYQPPQIAENRAIGWVFAKAVSGTYRVKAEMTGGESVSTTFVIDTASQLAAPVILSVSGSTSQVRVDWSGTADMRSFLLRLEKEPFATDTSVIAETVVGGEQRSLTFRGLSLQSGVSYRIVIFAFSNDLYTPGAIASPANFSASVSETFRP
ncbi:MAG TPA: hypothetical protein VK900_06185 [Anaerolineales bacterium]|nr:hypothetical protein [Anaerolineales bacterium]